MQFQVRQQTPVISEATLVHFQKELFFNNFFGEGLYDFVLFSSFKGHVV